ncbi:MAG TPA: hypothetical protein VNM39_13190 [Verrucomicrobiae bacterium]|nr:hypothetical protein [Verrucomicrobiae bacterium]
MTNKEALCSVCRQRGSTHTIGGLCSVCNSLPVTLQFHTTTASIGAQAHQPPRPERLQPGSRWKVEQILYVPPVAGVKGAYIVILWRCDVITPEPVTGPSGLWSCGKCSFRNYCTGPDRCGHCGAGRFEL